MKQIIKKLTIGMAVVLSSTSLGAFAGEAEVKALAAKKASVISRMHKKATKSLVNSAQDPVFAEYFTVKDKIAAKARIDQISLNVQAKFDVDEMCYIGSNGQEISRITGNSIAPDDDLSPDEASAIFFKPAFALKAKQSYISFYMSPDALKWVVAYTTPIPVNGKNAAILHFEHNLGEYQDALNKGLSGNDYVLAIHKDGYIISDSRAPISITMKGDKEEMSDYFKKYDTLPSGLVNIIDLSKKHGTHSFKDGGKKYFAAYKKVKDWTIVAVEK
jgi:hypothetical protein